MTGVCEPRFGRYLEEFEVGQRFEHWPGKTITEAENHAFCLMTLAASPLHVDAHYAESHMEQGRNLVVGTFVYSLLLGMSVPDTSGRAIAALGTKRLRHIKPVFHGDTLYASSTVVGVRPSRSRPATGIVTVETKGRNQDGDVVCEFIRSFLVPAREAQT